MSRKIPTPEEVARIIDHTILKPYATARDIDRYCEEAIKYGFNAVFVHPCWVKYCVERLKGTEVKVGSVVGFPQGAELPEVKAYSAEKLVSLGVQEIDMVMNISAFRNGDYDLVKKDIEGVVRAAGDVPVKVIIEVGYLTDEDIIYACKIAMEAGASFVKTATGLGPLGAFPHHVRIMRETVGNKMGVKAAGGIRDFKTAVRLIMAGADRIGTSTGVAVIETAKDAKFDEEEDPCLTCPSYYASKDKMPEDVYEYYKSKCLKCPHAKYGGKH
ncbi:MAG: deoxyribose-phosphate aldolase [Candidatus Baldrarchaeia archaeon]